MRINREVIISALFTLASAFFWGLYPVLIQRGTQTVPPLVLAVLTYTVATATAWIYLFFKRDFSALKEKKLYKDYLLIALYIVIIPTVLFNFGARLTSGVNASVLLLSEVLFTVVFLSFRGEVFTAKKAFGSLFILVGAFLLLFHGFTEFSWGDMLVIASTFTYPIGNVISKRVLQSITPASLLAIRLTLSLPVFIILSLIISPEYDYGRIFSDQWKMIIVIGILCLGLSKIYWFKGLKNLDVNSAVSLGMTFPVFSLLVLLGFGLEKISFQQAAGIIFSLGGVYLTVYSLKKSV